MNRAGDDGNGRAVGGSKKRNGRQSSALTSHNARSLHTPEATLLLNTMQPERLRALVAALIHIVGVVLGAVALTLSPWFQCAAAAGTYTIKLDLSSWSDSIGRSGGLCDDPGIVYSITTIPCDTGNAVKGVASTGIALLGAAALLFVVMSAWKRPPVLHKVGQAGCLLGGLFIAIGCILYASRMSGDLGLGSLVATCSLQPAPLVLLGVAAILAWTSSCVLCGWCKCDCSEDMNQQQQQQQQYADSSSGIPPAVAHVQLN